VERGQEFIGNSVIVNPSGDLVAGPASADEPEIVMAEINVMQARYRHWSEFNNPITDRRLDVYDCCLGYDCERGKRKGCRWMKKWNLMVPDEILNQSWGEVL